MSITTLGLASNGICEARQMQGLLAICELLAGGSVVTSLDLSSNALTSGGMELFGVRKLIEALPKSKLTSLDLDDNMLTFEIATSLAQAAGETCKLHTCELLR